MESRARVQVLNQAGLLKQALLLAVLTFLTVQTAGCVPSSENTLDPGLAQRTLDGFFRNLQDRNMLALRDAVDSQFGGDGERLLAQLTDALDAYQDIRIEAHVRRDIMDDDVLETSFRWNRRWRSQETGAETLASGTSVLRFRRTASGYKLTGAPGRQPWQ